MKSGVIGTVNGSGAVEDIFHSGRIEEGDPSYCLEMRESIQFSDGKEAQYGRAALSEVEHTEQIEIDEGNIISRERPIENTNYTEFLYVPDSFIAVTSSDGKFAFNLVEEAANVTTESIEIDIDQYVEERNDADPWKVGFKNNPGTIKNGIVHGEELLKNPNLSEFLNNSQKNQIGLEYSWNSFFIKCYIAESGYVEVYQPSSFDTKEFIEFIEDQILVYH